MINRASRTATAFHEAGHVVQALREGIAIRTVTIVREGDAAGHVAYAQRMRLHHGEIRLAVAEKRGRTALAGTIAQRRHSFRSVKRFHSDSDRATAADLAMSICASTQEAEAWLNLWTVQVEQHIKHRWWLVEGVATALLEHDTLDVQALAGIVATCGPGGQASYHQNYQQKMRRCPAE